MVLKEIRRFVDERYPGALLLAEANQWPNDLLPYFGDGDEFHMAFNFPIMPRMFMSIRREQCWPIIEIMDQLPAIPSNWRTSSLRGRLTAAARSMRVMSSGWIVRRAWSTLLRDNRLFDLSVVSLPDGGSASRAASWKSCVACGDGRGAVNAGAGASPDAAAGEAGSTDAAGGGGSGATKLVAGRTGRSTSAT